MNKKIFFTICAAIALALGACKEGGRYEIGGGDSDRPAAPVFLRYTPLYGGATLYFDTPDDEDVLTIDAEYVATNGKTIRFSTSFYSDSLNIYGLGDTNEHTINLYACDRSGNRSETVPVKVVPLESAVSRVAQSVVLLPGFSSFIVDWVNELKQSINIYIDFTFNDPQTGVERNLTSVYSSNVELERRFVNDLYLGPNDPLQVKVYVEDLYGNVSSVVDFGTIHLLQDDPLPKDIQSFPNANDSIGGVPMFFGDALEGRTRKLNDGIIDWLTNLNFCHTYGRGRTGLTKDGNCPWNIFIDLGDFYELSRIITVQRWSNGGTNVTSKEQYYTSENVGRYAMYYWDYDSVKWVWMTEVKIAVPTGISELEIIKQAKDGDMAYMYPNNPQYSKPTRWFRYEALAGFQSNYTDQGAARCLSEITLYGRKSSTTYTHGGPEDWQPPVAP